MKTREERIQEVADSSKDVLASLEPRPLVGQSREIVEGFRFEGKVDSTKGSSHLLHLHTFAGSPLWFRQRQSWSIEPNRRWSDLNVLVILFQVEEARRNLMFLFFDVRESADRRA